MSTLLWFGYLLRLDRIVLLPPLRVDAFLVAPLALSRSRVALTRDDPFHYDSSLCDVVSALLCRLFSPDGPFVSPSSYTLGCVFCPFGALLGFLTLLRPCSTPVSCHGAVWPTLRSPD